MDESTYSEFLADFGHTGITEHDLDSLLARARENDDGLLRLLVKQFRVLRRASNWLLSDLDETNSIELRRARESARLMRLLISDKA